MCSITFVCISDMNCSKPNRESNVQKELLLEAFGSLNLGDSPGDDSNFVRNKSFFVILIKNSSIKMNCKTCV
jgi:hypothetical protein